MPVSETVVTTTRIPNKPTSESSQQHAAAHLAPPFDFLWLLAYSAAALSKSKTACLSA